MELLGDSASALVVLLVLALLIESALSVIFNWRVFLEVFNGRGMKTLVMIAVSALTVKAFGISTVATLLQQYKITGSENMPQVSFWLTSLILAGGSSGVFQVLRKLGYRGDPVPADEVQKPVTGKAWVAIRAEQVKSVGPVTVTVDEKPTAGAPRLATVIDPANWPKRMIGIFFRDRRRWPQSGGHDVALDKDYTFTVSGTDAAGQPLPAVVLGPYAFANRAIVDFRVKL